MNGVSQAEFARILGVGEHYVSRLKQAGRLVLTADGKVDVEASRQRIVETAGGREDLAMMWARKMGREPICLPPAAVTETAPADAAEFDAPVSRQQALARKEHYLALKAKLEYERAVGAVVARDEVEAALDDLAANVRMAFENLPHRLAGQVAGKDYDEVGAILRREVHAVLHDLSREAQRRLDELTRGE